MSDEGVPQGWGYVSGSELARELGQRISHARRELAQILELLAHIDQRGVVGELGYGSVADLYADVAWVSRAEGKKQAERAESLHGRSVFAGKLSQPALPHTAIALAEGEIDVRHVDRIRRLHDSLSDSVPPEAWEIAEEALADTARGTTPDGMLRAINTARAHLDPDGTEPDARELANPQRKLHTSWQGDRLCFDGYLDREAGMLLEAALVPLAKPRPQHDGDRDGRTAAERHGDALADLIQVAVQSDTLGQPGSEPVTIMVTMRERDLRDGIGSATTMDGAAIPVAQLRRLACDANVIPAVLGTHGEVIDLGDKKRLANVRLRRALVLRDKGCAHPYCSAPASRCHVHHVRHWANRGGTDRKNAVLLCAFHHRQVHHTGWTVRIRDGRPEFQPPDCFGDREIRKPRSSIRKVG